MHDTARGSAVPAPEAEPVPVLEALHSTPARRYLSAEPIPDEVIWAVLDAAVRGPTGGNRQVGRYPPDPGSGIPVILGKLPGTE